MIMERTQSVCLLLFFVLTQAICLQRVEASLKQVKTATDTKFGEVFVAQAALPSEDLSASSEEKSYTSSRIILSQPIQLVRSLQNLQDKIMSGQEGALQKQPELLREIGEKFLTLSPDVWQDEHNLYALLIYLLNGGNPRVVRIILEDHGQGRIAQNLITGALAYTSHRREEFFRAFANLSDQELQLLPPALFLSIVLSTVTNTSEKDPALALKQLNQVRLLAPGTLFEESAIRRELRVAATLGKAELLMLLVRNYAHRFEKSPYVNNFWSEFRLAIPRIEKDLSDEQFETLVSYAPTMLQLMTYTEVSRAALIDARMERVKLSAQKALMLAHELNVSDAPIRLYYAASLAGSVTAEEAAKMLQTISSNDLLERDRPLLTAAQAIADRVSFSLSDDSQTVETQALISSQSQETLETQSKRRVGQQSDLPSIATETDQFIEQTREKINIVDKLLGEQI
ncbi:hypothetical protein H704_01015 [Bartonella bacilliformis Peru38]|nr:putative flagellar motor protein [Bartonella bacilliformis KC583]EYS88637.1 hypothetical protein X472_01188 [Bartonella bacilliformis San Pedro600-02]EYS94386.1 hypothetical protein X470_01090 [Bartonella bacilliformis Peru-18]KEG15873.1 hypothetical protein H709_00989 [Bartonella bacilliformis CUSCO5]KEG16129.1 hypothetical protein H705_01055 [Bartonella bacilliformis Cond044]KEG19776.1 hypothetical protein H704_01015 [Bartonella bacilliformis Peru38]KEG22180.1 hypothetical protein H703_0